jgi:hypothetical protein
MSLLPARMKLAPASGSFILTGGFASKGPADHEVMQLIPKSGTLALGSRHAREGLGPS